MRSLLVLASFGVAVTALACGDSPPPVAPQRPTVMPGDTIKAMPREPTGVDAAALDASVSPCDDFYQYACGSWVKATTIPSDESTWFRSFSVIHDRNEEILHQILEGYAKGENAGDAYAKPMGDFYASCMDETAIEQAGTKALDPWRKAIDAANSPAALTKLFGRFQSELGNGIVLEQSAAQDFDNAQATVAVVGQNGLGMPEKEYYLDTSPKMVELRAKYEAHVAAIMVLAGEPDAKAKASARKVVEIETAIAKAWMSKVDRRDPQKLHHAAKKAELGKVAPGFLWDAWLDGSKAKDVAVFNVNQPDYTRELGEMLGGKVSAADWKPYLRWHLYAAVSNGLGSKFVDESFRWRSTLTGAEKLPVRWKRCTRAVDGAMGEALAQPFVKKTLGTEGKATVVGMVQAIEDAMKADIAKIGWMDEPTRQAAYGKLGKIANMIAYPETWRNYDKLVITKSYIENELRASAFEYARALAKVGKPIDRMEWQMSPPTVNAYYDAQLNEMVFPAGILQPPFYSSAVPRATNFGGIGMVMGHELTHGFDDEGRQFDGDGNLKEWWSKSVNEEFERRAACVEKQFDGYSVLDGLHVNGKLTLGENIADLGGVKLALRSLAAQPPAAPTQRSPEQEFFLGYAQSWCGKLRDEALRHQVNTNEHSPPAFRVNGPLSNLPDFARAFSCKADAKMVRKERCEIW